MREYHIYICKPAISFFRKEIENMGLDKNGVTVLDEEKPNSGKIVIPLSTNNWFDIEDKLFSWKRNSEIQEVKDSGFWGQYSSCN